MCGLLAGGTSLTHLPASGRPPCLPPAYTTPPRLTAYYLSLPLCAALLRASLVGIAGRGIRRWRRTKSAGVHGRGGSCGGAAAAGSRGDTKNLRALERAKSRKTAAAASRTAARTRTRTRAPRTHTHALLGRAVTRGMQRGGAAPQAVECGRTLYAVFACGGRPACGRKAYAFLLEDIACATVQLLKNMSAAVRQAHPFCAGTLCHRAAPLAAAACQHI